MDRFQQAKNIATGMGNFLRMKVSLADKDIEEMHRGRYAVCLQCPNRNKVTDACSLCTCFLKLKTRVPGESCPAKHWRNI